MTRAELGNLKDNLNTGCYGGELNYYRDSTSYIDDIIHEIADSNTSIYYTDIINFISEHVEEVNDTIQEFGWDECGSDLYKAGRMAEYSVIEADISANLTDCLMVVAIDYLLYDAEVENLPDNAKDTLDSIIDEIDTDDRMDTLIDRINEEFNLNEE